MYATRHPPFGWMLASRNDAVWIGPADPGESTVTASPLTLAATCWSVYTTTGRWLSPVVLPRNVRLMEADAIDVTGVLLAGMVVVTPAYMPSNAPVIPSRDPLATSTSMGAP